MHFRITTYLIIMGLAAQCTVNAVIVPVRNSKKVGFFTSQTNPTPTAPTAPTNANATSEEISVGISEEKEATVVDSNPAEILWSHEIHPNYMYPPTPFDSTAAEETDNLVNKMLEEHTQHVTARRSPDSPRFIGNPEFLSIKIISAVKVGRVMCPCHATLRVDHNKDSIFMDVSAIKAQVQWSNHFFFVSSVERLCEMQNYDNAVKLAIELDWNVKKDIALQLDSRTVIKDVFKMEKEARWLLGNSRKGDCFGELSLLRLAPKAATVSAVVRPTTLPTVDEESSSSSTPKKIGPKLKVAALDALAFTRLFGPLREIREH
ncbi:hypothetical protein F5877DRAFT_70387 [Lentinula edodes]|nr:hypothetical protein F5877DRAFT_70387 [Lentinula edodes]